jgi:mono/diheme cytochrome c family protein
MMCAAMVRRMMKLIALPAALAVALLTTACGTEKISASRTADGGALYKGAVIFSQRCAGCHSISYAAAMGSAANIRDAQGNSGPNFNIRCERPIDRVLYAIENGGFSGQYMPQNIVVGQDAVDVAKFVATYAGHEAPKIPNVPSCFSKPIGTLPPGTEGLSSSSTSTVTSTSASASAAGSSGSGSGS